MIPKLNMPYAPNLVESMRSMGYSFQTALADIVDNSIAASSTRVEIVTLVENYKSYIAIIDNGKGMNSAKLFIAMQYGCANPNDLRGAGDMGRFGLGLKSASLSQCRKLTVISKKNGEISAYKWDIDYIISCGEWNVQELEKHEILAVPCIDYLSELPSGTIVLWEDFDRIKKSSIDFDEAIKKLLVNSIDHLSLIYHRLLNKNFSISINGLIIEPKDPFLEFHKGTQLKREQKINIDGSMIKVKPYILPHINKLSNEDIIKIGGKETLRSEQGFYIYRNKRLIIWGTWFKLGNKGEMTKLARVKVDIPNDMDYLWDIDVKKSKASLPEKIKINLFNAVIESCGSSEQVHEYRGKKILNSKYIHSWNVMKKRENEGVSLEINTDEPRIQKFIDSLEGNQKRAFFLIINDLETSLPLDYIYTELAKGKKTNKNLPQEEKDRIIASIRTQMMTYEDLGMSKNEFLDAILAHDKYANDDYLVRKISELRGENHDN